MKYDLSYRIEKTGLRIDDVGYRLQYQRNKIKDVGFWIVNQTYYSFKKRIK